MENFLGQIQAFGFGFAPYGWATCDGQTLDVQQNPALFSLLGNTFGGDGGQTFALPDLRGRMTLHQGVGAGLGASIMGQVGGFENTTLSPFNLPAHTHALMASTGSSTQSTAGGNVLATSAGVSDDKPVGVTVYAPAGSMTPMALPLSIVPIGGSQPFPILPPYLTVNICIALQGVYPSRN